MAGRRVPLWIGQPDVGNGRCAVHRCRATDRHVVDDGERVSGPREVGALGYTAAELVRLLIGGGLACAAAVSGQLTSAMGR